MPVFIKPTHKLNSFGEVEGLFYFYNGEVTCPKKGGEYTLRERNYFAQVRVIGDRWVDLWCEDYSKKGRVLAWNDVSMYFTKIDTVWEEWVATQHLYITYENGDSYYLSPNTVFAVAIPEHEKEKVRVKVGKDHSTEGELLSSTAIPLLSYELTEYAYRCTEFKKNMRSVLKNELSDLNDTVAAVAEVVADDTSENERVWWPKGEVFDYTWKHRNGETSDAHFYEWFAIYIWGVEVQVQVLGFNQEEDFIIARVDGKKKLFSFSYFVTSYIKYARPLGEHE